MKILFVRRHVIGRCIVFLAFVALLCGYIVLLKNNKHVKKAFNLKYKKRSSHSHKHHDMQHSKYEKVNKPVFNKIVNAALGKSEALPAQQKTPVYVVEEHHEVIPYWFEAVTKKIIPQYGNTLLHIDGHSDMAPPFYHRGLPFFKWPETKTDIRGLMQRNDAFIVCAAMTGLIDRIIWVWPDWDKKNHGSTQHHITSIEIGWHYVDHAFDVKLKSTCMCAIMPQTKKYGCATYTTDEKKELVSLPTGSCNVTKTFRYEEIHEKLALKLSKTKKWITDKENVLLDIDEDYYGCEYAVTPLFDAGFNKETIDPIYGIVTDMFCSNSKFDETKADKMVTEVISAVRRQIKCSKVSNKPFCKIKAEKIFIKGLKNFSNTLFCDDENIQKYFKELVKYLKTLSNEMLLALQKVGFCLNTSLKSMDQFGERKFTPCFGNNSPVASVVLVHTPSALEISTRTHLMGQFLDHVKNTPKLVTVCRSVRDGYTPRKYFERIEQDIVNTLRKRYKNLSFHYDESLLGGKKGWPYYHYNNFKNSSVY